ncbi:MAG: penicillin-binding protein [Candidatus Saccharimonadales bacterium]
MQQSVHQSLSALQRVRLWYAFLIVIASVFVVRLFYLQIIKHDYYQKAAFRSQLKQYEIPAERGTIIAHSGDRLTPLVLNEKLYTLFADPVYIRNTHSSAQSIQQIIGGSSSEIEKQIKTADTRYVVLAKRITSEQKGKLDQLHLKGIGTREQSYRTYPNKQLASQVLGFVNQDGDGTYGVEQALDSQLKGQQGELKAITDAQGIPLVGNKDNVIKDPVSGKKTVLTIDVGMQQMAEDALKAGLDAASSKSGSLVIMDINSGAIKAMANYPTFDPSQYYNVTDSSLFSNAAIAAPIEVGSIMKTLTTSAAIDQGVISKDSAYYDPGTYVIDNTPITNVEGNSIIGTHTIQDFLSQSLNTGATWILMQMGGGQINQKARDAWHDYMVNHFHLGSATGIEQGNGEESPGTIPDPDKGYGLNIHYANTAFGQGMSATILQMTAADAAILNGGTYYVPHVVEGFIDNEKSDEIKSPPMIWKKNIVKPSTGLALQQLMEGVVAHNYQLYKVRKPTDQYIVGGKTGTAQYAQPGGGYFSDRYNGTFLGFVGGDKPQYMIGVKVNDPHISGFAGAGAAAPIFASVSASLLDNFNVTPKSL